MPYNSKLAIQQVQIRLLFNKLLEVSVIAQEIQLLNDFFFIKNS
jgi:hypothetical protein